jgi:hypothetical protein
LGNNPLERRDVLKLAAGACLVGAGEGCAPGTERAPLSAADIASQLDPAAADALLAKIDARLAALGGAELPDDVLPLSRLPRGPEFDAELESTRALVRKSIRSLYMTGRFLDMPDEMRVHPGVQARMWDMQPEMDDAVLGMTARLERMTGDDHRRVQAYLRKDDRFGERLAKVLEGTAVEDGLSFKRSFGVRSTALQLTQRMAAQSPALVTEPIVSKVRRIEAHPRSDAEQLRRLGARVGEEAFWAHQERLALLHQGWKVRLAAAGALESATAVANAGPGGSGTQTAASSGSQQASSTSSPGSNTMGTGAVTMGFGAGSVTLGLIFYGLYAATSASGFLIPALVLGVTIGPILLLVGLIILIVGACMKADE